MSIPVGTRSVLWGVHQFLWHPLTVLLAWRKLYRTWPEWWQLVGILLHDTPGYWGKPNLDGIEGKQHPYLGAYWAAKIVGWLRLEPPCIHTYYFTLLHSRAAAKAEGHPVSPLYAADKASIIYDPKWWYLCRARLSGEIEEFKAAMIKSGGASPGLTSSQWYDIYKHTVRNRAGIKELL